MSRAFGFIGLLIVLGIGAYIPLPADLNGQEKGAGSKLTEVWERGESNAQVHLEFREVERRKGDQDEGPAAGKTVVVYNLLASGFPKGKVYTLWVWPFGKEPRPVATGFAVDDSGKLICSPRQGQTAADQGEKWCDEPLESMRLDMVAARGEPKRLAVFSQDQKVKAFAKVIPSPIEAKDGPCRLSIELAEPVGQGFQVAGEGFEPNEEVLVTDQSEEEVMRTNQRARSDGKIGGYLLPAVIGKDSGSASWSVRSRACNLTVNYKWGRAAFEWQ